LVQVVAEGAAMTRHAFEEALAFEGSGGHYRFHVDDRWEAQPGNLFGGFVLALVVRSAGLMSTASRPLSLACQFVRPARAGVPIEATVDSLRRGRTNELLSVTLSQADKPVTEAYVRAVDRAAGPSLGAAPASASERSAIAPAHRGRGAGAGPHTCEVL
jgi:hypothetical protein